MPTKTEKRPVHSFTAEERLNAVLRVQAGESKASVARDIGVAVSTFRGWCKNEKNTNFDKRERSPRKWTEATKLEVPFTLNSRSNSATFTNSSTAHFKEDIPAINSALATEKNLIKLRMLGVEMGLDVPETIPSEQDRAKIMEILRKNQYIIETFKFLLYQYHQNLSIIKNTMANSVNTLVTTPEGTVTISDEEYRAPPEETQTSNQKVWNWLLNHHHGAYEEDET